jgi:hypothetical protein
MAFDAEQTATGPTRQSQNGIPIRDQIWPVALSHKLNEIIFMVHLITDFSKSNFFRRIFHRRAFRSQAFWCHEFGCVTRRDCRKKRTGLPFAFVQ